jgi:hypothetical protein
MARSLIRRIAVLCCLLLVFTAPWAAAEPREAYGPASSQLLAQLWSWLSGFWSEEGCMIDPSGWCGGDEGCMLDPDGRNQETPSPLYQEEGCMIDPNGRCGEAPRPGNLDEGCMLDPSGCGH